MNGKKVLIVLLILLAAGGAVFGKLGMEEEKAAQGTSSQSMAQQFCPDIEEQPEENGTKKEFRELRGQSMAQQFYPDFEEQFEETPKIVIEKTVDGKTLMVMELTGRFHACGWKNLLAGVWDESADCPVGECYELRGDGGQWELWQERDGWRLLMSNTSTAQGCIYGSGLWLLDFDGTLEPVPELPELTCRCSILPEGSTANTLLRPGFYSEESGSYWDNYWADAEEKGIRLYKRNDYYTVFEGKQEPGTELGLIPLHGD